MLLFGGMKNAAVMGAIKNATAIRRAAIKYVFLIMRERNGIPIV